MQYNTALRAYTSKRVEEIQSADILEGIPCYNNETTIAHVIQMVSHGLATHYKGMRSVIFVADGGSTDDTREMAKEFQLKLGRRNWYPSTVGRGERARPYDPFLRRRIGWTFASVPWWIRIYEASRRNGSNSCWIRCWKRAINLSPPSM